MTDYRWISKVLVGPWRNTRREAMSDALGANHATLNSGKGAIIVLRAFAMIETRKDLLPVAI